MPKLNFIDTGKRRSLVSETVRTLRAEGASNAFALLDTATNEVFVYSKPAGSSEPSPRSREKVIDLPWRDPAEFDPLAPEHVFNSTPLFEDYEAQMRKTLGYLIAYYRPIVSCNQVFLDCVDRIFWRAFTHQDALRQLPDARARWNWLLSSYLCTPDQPLTKPRCGTKRENAKG